MHTTTVEVPAPRIIVERIRECRQELTALRRLHRLAQAANAARELRQRRRQRPLVRSA